MAKFSHTYFLSKTDPRKRKKKLVGWIFGNGQTLCECVRLNLIGQKFWNPFGGQRPAVMAAKGEGEKVGTQA